MEDIPLCACGNLCQLSNISKKTGKQLYRSKCKTCANIDRGAARREGKIYSKHKQDRCVKCGFIPEHKCQLDVDHIDGNHSNNDPSNLQTLCANCHRLKTYQNKEWDSIS